MKGLMEQEHGMFTISLDFEMLWGVIDLDIESFASHVAGVYCALPRLLSLFRQYGIHATVAPVGLILCRDAKDTEHYRPSAVPTYRDSRLSPYENHFIDGYTATHEHLFYAPSLVSLLKDFPNVEIGSHTFCHYYCLEGEQSLEQFEADLQAFESISRDHGFKAKSIVFPRNNVSHEYMMMCKKYGITSFRGNPPAFFRETGNPFIIQLHRACRLIDSYVNIGGTYTPSIATLYHDGIVNVCASRFLRPYTPLLAFADGLRLRRIKHEMKRAALSHRLYHLWWHPMNIGVHTDRNLAFIEEILKYYVQMNQQYGMQSCTMAEVASRAME